MVSRSFAAFDNEAFVIDPSSPSGTPGDPIINNSNTPVGRIFTFNSGFPYQTITLNDTSTTPDIFNDDDEDNHIITNGGTLVPNGTPVESESYHYVRLLDDDGDPIGPRITITVFSRDGVTQNIWGMASDTQLIDGAKYVKVGGSNNGDSLYDNFVPCFTAGTLIATRRGERPIEALSVGDEVVTRDNGFQAVRWIGTCTLSAETLRKSPAKRPVQVKKNAFAEGVPARDTAYSPNHRLLMTRSETSMLFGDAEVLAAAKHLTRRAGVSVSAGLGPVTYVHLLFDRHEAILSEGLWSESFLPGEVGIGGLDTAQQEEVYDLFPALWDGTDSAASTPARRILRKHEALAEAAE